MLLLPFLLHCLGPTSLFLFTICSRVPQSHRQLTPATIITGDGTVFRSNHHDPFTYEPNSDPWNEDLESYPGLTKFAWLKASFPHDHPTLPRN